jgi:choline dehydrogenase-like flavoprotein
MSATADTGVVDRACRVHGVRNLYIASSSVFPTGGSAPPTLTIIALAIRVADRLRMKSSPTGTSRPVAESSVAQ